MALKLGQDDCIQAGGNLSSVYMHERKQSCENVKRSGEIWIVFDARVLSLYDIVGKQEMQWYH